MLKNHTVSIIWFRAILFEKISFLVLCANANTTASCPMCKITKLRFIKKGK